MRGVIEAQTHEVQREHVEQGLKDTFGDGRRVQTDPGLGQAAQTLKVVFELFQDPTFGRQRHDVRRYHKEPFVLSLRRSANLS